MKFIHLITDKLDGFWIIFALMLVFEFVGFFACTLCYRSICPNCGTQRDSILDIECRNCLEAL